MIEKEKIDVLLVDDKPENLFSLETLLWSSSLNIVKASSGNEALALMLEHDFAVVLLDVNMPDMDGFETAELMRGRAKTRNVPIIFVTALSEETSYMFRGYEAGAVDYISKPIEPMILKSKVDIFCELHRHRIALMDSERKYRSLFEEMIDGFAYHKILLDEDGKPIDYIFLEINNAFERLTGLRKEDVVGQRVTQVIAGIRESDFDWIGVYGNVALTGRGVRFEEYLEVLGKWFSVAAYSPQRGYFGAVFEDVTERKINEKALKASLKEKEILLKEIHHRVKNNFMIIYSLLQLQSRAVKDKESMALFRESQNRVHSLSMIHEQIYRSKDQANVRFSQYIGDLAKYLVGSYGINPNLVQLVTNIADISVDLDLMVPCGLIVNELITNALKHGFPNGRQGEVRIDLLDTGSDKLTMVVSDNGVGMPEGMDLQKQNTLGLELVCMLTKQIGGDLVMESKGGVEFRITFNRNRYKRRG